MSLNSELHTLCMAAHNLKMNSDTPHKSR